jgi:hypothetical protein
MRRVIIKEFEQLSEALSNYNAMFAFRIMNLCVKAEEVALLPVKVMVEGEIQNLEQCTLIKKKDDYSFVIIPKFDEDVTQIGLAIANVHPEFKQKVESTTVEVPQSDGSMRKVESNYIVVTMPTVDDDRYDILKDGVKLSYDECKARMEAANAKADVTFAELTVDEDKENIENIKQEREKLNDQWYGQRDKLYNEKLQEIEDAHNKWLAGKAETVQRQQEEDAARGEDVTYSMRMGQEEEV